MDKILRIRMQPDNDPIVKTESINAYAGLGGRAMTSSIIANEVPPLCHPLGEDNKLVIAPGLLSGTAAVMSGRVSVGCKSPLTGGIKEANAGGQPSQMLARLGYAAIVLEGKPKEGALYKVLINSDGVQVLPADDLKMMGNYALVDKMKSEYGDKIGCISIGPVGEMKMSIASVAFTDIEVRPTRHAARGGVGAVMGAKGIKVIVVDDKGVKMRTPADPGRFQAANKAFTDGLKQNPTTGKGLPAFGTDVLMNIINEAGALPTHNFKWGKFDGANKIGGETMAETETSRGGKATHGCHRGCIIQCSGTYVDKNGDYLTKQPEYETVWAHGANCGIDDLDAIANLDRLDDDFGIDTIEMGATIAVAMEAGLARFGDAQAALNFVKEVGKGTPLGRILGGGAAATGRAYGIERVPVVKGQSMPAYDPRAVLGQGVTYATTPMGADHTAGYAVATNILGVGGSVDPLKPEGQIELSRNLQIATAAIDSTGMCLFIAFAIMDQPETFQALIDLLNACYNLTLTADDVTALGKSVLTKERDFNTRAGFTSKDDRLPDFFKREPFPPHNVTFAVSDEALDQVHNW